MKDCKCKNKQLTDRECHVCYEAMCNTCGKIIDGKPVCNDCLLDSEYYHDGHVVGGCYYCRMD